MSALLAKRSPLPAVAIAAAFAAATPADAGILAPEAGATTISESVAALLAQARAVSATAAVSVLEWATLAQWQPGTVAPGDIDSHLGGQLDHVEAGLARLQNWSYGNARNLVRLAGAAYRDALATVRTAQQAFASEPRDAYVQIVDAGRAVGDAMENLAERLEAGGRPMKRVLTAFTLKAQTQFAADTAQVPRTAFAQVVTQPFLDAYAQVLDIEAKTRMAVDFGALHGALAKADLLTVQAAADSDAIPVSLHAALVERIDAALSGIAQLQAMLNTNAEVIAVAKAEFLRVLNDTTKLTLNDLPKRDARRVMRTHPPIDRASDEMGDPKVFGRRIDFDRLAHRYVSGEEL